MAPMLQDIAYLLGLPCVGATVGVTDVDADWMNVMHQWFAPVQRMDDAPAYVLEFLSHPRGPTKKWILQFYVPCILPSHLLYDFQDILLVMICITSSLHTSTWTLMCT